MVQIKCTEENKVKVKSLSHVPWTVAYQAPLPMGFARQEYWSGVPLPSPARVLVPPKSVFLIILFFLPSNTQSYSLKKIYCS